MPYAVRRKDCVLVLVTQSNVGRWPALPIGLLEATVVPFSCDHKHRNNSKV